MEWYEKLNDYFPEHEMKDRNQIQDLIDEKDVYHLVETDDYIVLYAEFPTFVFIDYLLVTSQARGKGIGTKVLDRMKKKGKLILLEVEPKDDENEDTRKRLAFYYKNGFQKADRIRYVRETDQGEPYFMHILYWSPTALSQDVVMREMEKACEEIHNFRAKQYYGRLLADPEKALTWKH
ncbi:GNAT family N-acetyltransferase [Paenibacillus sp.]|uniref:GNAT family N-acetyltransferase n=1 Tax=Paenibacillus sp. TaxID=58172 RepID=UPI002D637233|nr:GNAT family N-acetyltransferase [Paenibacillus sp.]HZG58675.1 GNAT family N-acetyltransferase [Paenibacillus sp.]